jgi:hypothetical protein
MLSSQGHRDELHKQLLLNLRDTLSSLRQDIAKLKAECDVALIEIKEIATSKRWVLSPWISDSQLTSKYGKLRGDYG